LIALITDSHERWIHWTPKSDLISTKRSKQWLLQILFNKLASGRLFG